MGNVTLFGSISSPNYSMLTIEVNPHFFSNATYINEEFTGTYFEVLVDNVYLDFTDLNKLIKNYIKAEIIRYIHPEFTSGVRIYLRKNHYSVRDSIWPSFWNEEKVGEFSSIERIENFSQKLTNGTLFKIEIYIDPQVDNYSARILNILDVSGTIGGVYELLYTFVGLVIGRYSSRSLHRSIDKRIEEREVEYKGRNYVEYK